MNDPTVAAEKEESMEAVDLIELGEVSEETKGLVLGVVYDGGVGKWG